MDARAKNCLQQLAQEAAAHGDALHVVGGTLRDCLLHREFQDLDLACPNAGHWATWFARNTRSKCIPLHSEPGKEVFRVPLGKRFFCDFSTLQGSDIQEDLACRDFTLNAIAQPLEQFLNGGKNFIDPYGGLADIQGHRIRLLPGFPFQDDPLRMLRATRLSANLGFEIESETLEAIGCNVKLIERVSAERISQELLKLFASPDPRLPLLEKSGLLGELRNHAGVIEDELISPGTVFDRLKNWWHDDTQPLAQFRDDYRHYFETGENRALFGIAALVIPATPPDGTLWKGPLLNLSRLAWGFMEHYRFSNQQRDCVAGLSSVTANWIFLTRDGRPAPPEPAQMFRWAKAGGHLFPSALLMTLMAHPLGDAPPESLKVFLETLYVFYTRRYLPASKLKPLLSGNDLMQTFNLRPSPLFKQILGKIEEARVLGEIQTREQAESLTRLLIANSTES